MDGTPCRRFFREPSGPRQRQDEALRAAFVDGLPQEEAAQRFGYAYAASRQLVLLFRRGCGAGTPPPFCPGRAPAGPRPHRPRRRLGRSSRPWPTPGP